MWETSKFFTDRIPITTERQDMKEYEVKVTYVGYITLQATDESKAKEVAMEKFSDSVGSWDMAKCAEYEVQA